MKSSLLKVLFYSGFNIKNLDHNGFKLNMWDVGGQEILRQFWDQYLDNTDALVFVIDSSDVKRIQEARNELFKLLDVIFSARPNNLRTVPLSFSPINKTWCQLYQQKKY